MENSNSLWAFKWGFIFSAYYWQLEMAILKQRNISAMQSKGDFLFCFRLLFPSLLNAGCVFWHSAILCLVISHWKGGVLGPLQVIPGTKLWKRGGGGRLGEGKRRLFWKERSVFYFLFRIELILMGSVLLELSSSSLPVWGSFPIQFFKC